jgi:signal transduction histidine kinase
MLVRQGPLPLDVAVFAVLFACAAYGGRRTRWAAFVSAIIGAAIAGVFVGAVLQPVGAAYRLQSGVSVGGVTGVSLLLSWTAGQLARTWRVSQRNRQAADDASRRAAAEQERTRIARDMHDVVAHSLAVVIAQSDGAARLRSVDPGAVEEALATISATARAALADVRVLLQQLRYDDARAPQPALGDLDELFDGFRAAGLGVLRSDEGEPRPMSVPVQIAAFRVAQESLTNALRHGGDSAEVRLGWAPGGLEVRIENPFRAVTVHGRPGNGVTGMQERAALVGGHLHAGPDGDRWRVIAWFPAGVAADAPAAHLDGVP